MSVYISLYTLGLTVFKESWDFFSTLNDTGILEMQQLRLVNYPILVAGVCCVVRGLSV